MSDNTLQADVIEAPATKDTATSAPVEVVDQETLDAVLAQKPVKEEVAEEETSESLEEEVQTKETNEGKVFGKYANVLEAEKAFKEMQARATKAEQAIKEIERKTLSEKSLAELQNMDYDEKLEYLLKRDIDRETLLQEFKSKLEPEYSPDDDSTAMDKYIGQNRMLREYGLDEIFREIASKPEYREYTFESIYEAKIKPMIQKVGGTKIKVKEKPIMGNSSVPTESFGDVSKMSDAQYEKHRLEILRSAGVRV